jgi:hypothetical protein
MIWYMFRDLDLDVVMDLDDEDLDLDLACPDPTQIPDWDFLTPKPVPEESLVVWHYPLVC